MRKVKLFEIHGTPFSEFIEDQVRVIGNGVSNWEEIEDEDFEFLKQFVNRRNLDRSFGNTIIIVEEFQSIPTFINDMKQLLEKEKQRMEKEKRLQEQKKIQRAIQRKAKDQEEKKKIYEELKKEFGE